MANFFEELCRPNPQATSDSEANERLFQKNKKHLALLSLILVISLIKSNFSEASVFAIVLRTSLCIFLVFSFLCFCRTRIWIYYLIVTVFLSALPFLISFYAAELSFEAMGLAFSGSSTLLLISDRKRYIIVFALAQLLALNTVLKPVFIATFETLNTEVFVSKFITTASFQVIVTLIANIYIQLEIKSVNQTICRANRTIGSAISNYKDVLDNFSQEIRNPLQSLIGNLELTLLQALQPPSTTLVETARVCAEVLLQRINNILDTVQLEREQFKLTPRPVQIYDLVTKVWQISSELIKKKDLAGMLKIQRDIPSNLLLDQCRVKQILFNLLNNAVKFTNKGTIYLTLKWLNCPEINDRCFEPKPYESFDEGLFEKEESFSLLDTSERLYNEKYFILSHMQSNFAPNKLDQSSKKGVLKIALRDSGRGMNQETFEKVFGKFSQVYNYRAKNDKGAGLGLFVTSQLARKMGGDVRAFTQQGVGTTFIVCIPCEGIIQ